MSQSRIFRDRDKLSPRYIPPIISHREKQFEAAFETLKQEDNSGGPSYIPVHVLRKI